MTHSSRHVVFAAAATLGFSCKDRQTAETHSVASAQVCGFFVRADGQTLTLTPGRRCSEPPPEAVASEPSCPEPRTPPPVCTYVQAGEAGMKRADGSPAYVTAYEDMYASRSHRSGLLPGTPLIRMQTCFNGREDIMQVNVRDGTLVNEKVWVKASDVHARPPTAIPAGTAGCQGTTNPSYGNPSCPPPSRVPASCVVQQVRTGALGTPVRRDTFVTAYQDLWASQSHPNGLPDGTLVIRLQTCNNRREDMMEVKVSDSRSSFLNQTVWVKADRVMPRVLSDIPAGTPDCGIMNGNGR